MVHYFPFGDKPFPSLKTITKKNEKIKTQPSNTKMVDVNNWMFVDIDVNY